jgi:hypothetical protein
MTPEGTQRPAKAETGAEIYFYARRHLRFGWWSLLIFLTLGVVLETLHGFKVGWYLNVSNETRRLMWTLAHAHGALLGVIHVAFAATVGLLAGWSPRARSLASVCLMASSVLLPGGFFLGGIFIHAGDPGLGILLVPLGALALFVAVLLTARGTGAGKSRPANPDAGPIKPKSTAKEKSGS